MPGVFKALGLEFQYPDNWLAEHEAGDVDAEEGQGVQVIVSSPQTAFWQLSRFRAGAELESLFDEALGALRAEYKNIEVEPCSNETVEGRQITGFDVSFFCLDLTTTCWLRGLKTPQATYLLLCQAEDREFSETGPVFRAMLASVLRNFS
tara:strand:- start:44 stop:493 length:450 start_codon:yes stop_codon:yes gene_type:complete